MAGINKPWYAVGGKNLGNPFSSIGIDWCSRCKTEVDTDTCCAQRGTTFTYKKVCKRCGAITANGIYDNVAMITQTPLPAGGLAWIGEGGRDRR